MGSLAGLVMVLGCTSSSMPVSGGCDVGLDGAHTHPDGVVRGGLRLAGGIWWVVVGGGGLL